MPDRVRRKTVSPELTAVAAGGGCWVVVDVGADVGTVEVVVVGTAVVLAPVEVEIDIADLHMGVKS